jgi:hypothetical protein
MCNIRVSTGRPKATNQGKGEVKCDKDLINYIIKGIETA